MDSRGDSVFKPDKGRNDPEKSKAQAPQGVLMHTGEQMSAMVGSVFAERYEIISVIGHGGMSTVYKARHTYMDKIVAVKVLRPHLTSDPMSLQRFQHESKLASCLSHPNIISVHDFGITKDQGAFLVMDFLEGITLGEVLDSGGAINEKEALEIFRQICKGLIHAHKRNVLHRDLKPRNLVLTVDEDNSILVKIVDFG
ncbi:MAG: serine/threonine protein kinase, partial [Candidatus Obscuribacterales bacterium]|nr:serine/threonine protein kinase [Candidatus Obscuribacterales bacterium]